MSLLVSLPTPDALILANSVEPFHTRFDLRVE